MSFALHIDGPRWRAWQDSVRDELGAAGGLLAPVAKGNGYGLGLALLGAEAERLGAATVAVGLPHEVAEVRAGGFVGDVLVLSPWIPGVSPDPADDPALVLTASSPEAARALGERGVRHVVEGLTSMRRHGIEPERLAAAGDLAEGLALHLPLDLPTKSRLAEVKAWLEAAEDARLPLRRLWVSHLTAAEVGQAARLAPGAQVVSRVGTRLWLGDRGALRPTGAVLDVHRLRRGDRYGYRQRRAARAGWLLVVAGGTAHGVALSAPTAAASARQRAVAAGTGALEAAGRSLSPFHVAGKQRWFAEPPHMQCSMLLLPVDVAPPAIGDRLAVDVRMTTARFDEVLGL